MISASDKAVFRAHVKLQLQELIISKPNTLMSAIADEALDYHCPVTFFSDLLQHGCVSGMVCSLIYYADTHAFYDTHYDEIDEVREDWDAETGQALTIKGDLKNFLAWFAFEQTAYQLASELCLVT